MKAETIFFLIIVFVALNFIFERILSYLNIRNISPKLPEEAEDIYTAEKYEQSQKYLKRKARFGMITSSFSVLLILLMLFFNGFAFTDQLVKNITDNPILQALLFFGILGLTFDILSIPFDIYAIFKIEEEFGFNKMRPVTFITDKLKSWLLGAVIGGVLLSAIIWIYLETGKWFVVIAFVVMALFGIFMSMFYTTLIVPLFNKLKPLPDGELKSAIENFGMKAGFPISKISVIDNSKRSTKSNAYFSGLGKKKRIVLFDTLIEKHTTGELVAVLAHEIGHFKLKHIQKGLFKGLLQTSVLLILFYFFLGYPVFQQSIGALKPSFHMGIVVFGLLYSPVSLITGLIDNITSRKNEFSADAFAAKFELAVPLSNALKKLSSDNLSNLTPHPVYVFFHYSHPPLLKRLEALQKTQSDTFTSLKKDTI